MGSTTDRQSAETVSRPTAIAKADSFFGWDQLILFAVPFPIMFIAGAAYVLGLDNDAADSIRALYLTPFFLLSFVSMFTIPVLLMIVLLFLLGRNVFLKKPRRLVLYAVILIILPAAMKLIDKDYLRFVLQEPRFKALLAERGPLSERSAHCFVFDRIQDNFYFGGANFAPFEKLILYVSDDIAVQDTPRIDRISSDGQCPGPDTVRHIRHLKGRFYLASTSRD